LIQIKTIVRKTAYVNLLRPDSPPNVRCGFLHVRFRMTDPDGGFEIAAPGKLTYILVMSDPDVAFGFVNFGDRNVSLPGRYLRSRSEIGCWVNDLTPTKICAE
jgi:hypothetical protein